MFHELHNMLAGLTSLTLSLAANPDNTITVTVTPMGAKTAGALNIPLSLTGTPVELDEGFATILAGYTAKRQDLSEQLAATEAILEAARKESADKAKKAIAKPAKSSTPVVADDDEDSDGDQDDEGASNTAPASTVSTSTPAVAASDASDLWA